MEIDTKEFKKIIEHVFRELRTIHEELMAHQILIETLEKELGKDRLRNLLAAARNSPAISQVMHEEYEVPLGTLDSLIEKSVRDQDLLRFLRDWKPTGRIN